jgi:hypothetical protein
VPKLPVLGVEPQKMLMTLVRPELLPWVRLDIDGVEHIPEVGPAIMTMGQPGPPPPPRPAGDQAPLIHGRFAGGFGWIAYPDELMERSATAFADGGRVWLIDPLWAQGIESEIEALGTVAGVIMTYVGHDRDVAWMATRYGVPVYLPRHVQRVRLDAQVEHVEGRVPESPLQLVPSIGRGLLSWFRDTAVWWPAAGALAVGDTLGSAGYYVRPGETLAVHPLRRLSPPTELLTLRPDRVYGGHGRSVTEDATAAVARAVRTARAERWAAWGHSLRQVWRAVRARRAGSG